VRLAEALPPALEGRDLELTGLVAELPHLGRESTRFVFHVEQGGAAVPRGLSLAWYAERGRGAQPAVPPPKLLPGERWRLTVRLKRPRGLANPHGFDFEPWALERNLRATGYVRTQPAPVRLSAEVPGWPQSLHRERARIRESMGARLADAPLGGVLVALAIGDQASIAPAQWETFWRTGVGHLVSISGLHITMLAALAFAVAFFVASRVPGMAAIVPARKAAAVFGLAAALGYTLLAGFAVPAQRTLVMLAVVTACVLADRPVSPSRVLALAVVAVLAIDPWAVLAGGFWLSFGAVAAIFLALGARAGGSGRVAAAAREQAAVTVALLPMLVLLFQEVSLVSPLANALAIPLVSLVVVPLTLTGAFLDWGLALEAGHALLAFGMVALEAMAAWPGAVLESHAPHPWAAAAAIVGAAWILAPRGVPMRSCGAAWMAPLFLVAPAQPAPGEAWVDVLDVGNGLAVVVRTAHHALVYDTGPAWSAESNGGSRVVVPFLRGEGVRALDALVISHADDDHYGGAFSLAASRGPAWLLSPLAATDPLHLMVARSTRCEAGQSWTWDHVTFTVLHPPRAAHAEPRRRENDRSCVVRVVTAGSSLLLSGDVEARSEAEMVRGVLALSSEVLLAPHHGSKTSSTAAFLDAVGPRHALFSVGHRNRHRHPHPAVVARYLERGVRIHRTDRDGALHLRLGERPDALDPVRRRAARPRYWSDR
jgi:competence protein ComEC